MGLPPRTTYWIKLLLLNSFYVLVVISSLQQTINNITLAVLLK